MKPIIQDVKNMFLMLFLMVSCVTEKDLSEQVTAGAKIEEDSLAIVNEINAVAKVNTQKADTAAIAGKQVRADLNALKRFADRYAYEVKLLDNKPLRARLKKLLGVELF